MRSLYLLGGPLRRELRAQPVRSFKRFKYSKPLAETKKVKDRFRGANAEPWVPTATLPDKPARTRFAPSPTGYLHLGSLRTALYNYLLAKATNGQFVLRIEDTDRTRVVDDAEARILEDLRWAGLQWDEGPDVGGPFGPYRQSERLKVYQARAQDLWKKGRAYRCFCPPEDLEWLKTQKRLDGSPVGYSGTCSHIPREVSNDRAAKGEAHCIRLKAGSKTAPNVHDLVYGHYRTNDFVEDFILMKRDGYPTYHFANVVDDLAMGITHVVRGAEWLISTPKHLLLYNALGSLPPKFAHVGLLTDQDDRKLSKRHGDIDIASYRKKRYLPDALLNYVSLLGWSPVKEEKGKKGKKREKGEKGEEDESDVMSLQEMIEKFHLKFTKGDVKVNDKLRFLQSQHLLRALGEAETARETIDKFILPPVLEAVRGIETAPETKKQLAVGPMVSAAQSANTADGLVGRDYVEKLLSAESYKYAEATVFVRRAQYLIWEIPPPFHAFQLEHFMDSVGDIVLADHETGRRWNIGPQPARVVAFIEGALEAIAVEEWNKSSLERALLPCIEAIYHHEASTETQTSTGEDDATETRTSTGEDDATDSRTSMGEDDATDSPEPPEWVAPKEKTPIPTREVSTSSQKSKGWPFLRWIFCANMAGAPLVDSMVVLGREDTMKRVRSAHHAAITWQKNHIGRDGKRKGPNVEVDPRTTS